MAKINKLSHNSIYYKQEFPDILTPTNFRTAITAPLFFWDKLFIIAKSLIPKKKVKPVEEPTPEIEGEGADKK